MIELHEIEDYEVTQQALEEREAKLLEAQEVAQLGFYELDLRTRRWTSSETLERIVNIPDDYPRTIEGWAALIHPDSPPSGDRRIAALSGNHQPQRDRAIANIRIVRYGSDDVRWVHGLGRVRFDASGRPAVLFGTVQDVTDRKVAEIALQQAHDEAELRVQERTAELGACQRRTQAGRMRSFNARWNSSSSARRAAPRASLARTHAAGQRLRAAAHRLMTFTTDWHRKSPAH